MVPATRIMFGTKALAGVADASKTVRFSLHCVGVGAAKMCT